MLKEKMISITAIVLMGTTLISEHSRAQTNIYSQSNQKGLEQEISKSDKEIDRIQNEKIILNNQIKKFEDAIASNNQKLDETKKQIAQSTNQIVELQNDINDTNARIINRVEKFKQRARVLQETNGTHGYLEYILGSKDFSDFQCRSFENIVN